MPTFADRLKEEIEYLGLTRKELADRAEIKKRALDMYLGTQESMPPADVAVRIAKTLNVSVEYLVTGENSKPQKTCKNRDNSSVEKDLKMLPQNVADSITAMIHTLAARELDIHKE